MLKDKTTLRFWLMMAVIDVGISTVLWPLGFYVALQWDNADYFRFWLLMGGMMLLSAISYGLSWFVSWKIYSKGQ